MRFHIISLFPGAFDSYIGESIIKRAILDKKIEISFYNPRDYADDKWKRVDQKPYAGGPGMVIQVLPVAKAIEAVQKKIEARHKRVEARKKKNKSTLTSDVKLRTSTKIIFLSPSGKQFDTPYAKKTAQKFTDIIIICGRYEGIDARVRKMFKMEEVSVGPFVLTGGELPALIMIDCISRQVEGVLGNFSSLEETRTASKDSYTRPEVIEYKGKKYKVPKVLLSGDHKKIESWRAKHK
jgi:tRNA (guanine37-N1)-methyltransferase